MLEGQSGRQSGRPEGRPLHEDGEGHADYDRYADITLGEADHTAQYIAGCYAGFPRFAQFAAYSMFYFAAASYSEMARRLNVHSPDGRFLCSDRASFRDATVRLSPITAAADRHYADAVAQAIEPLNIAGLCEPGRRNWYPVDLDETMRAAAKLGVTRQQIACDILQPSGLATSLMADSTAVGTDR